MKTGKLLKTIPTHEIGDRPRGVKVSPDGNSYLVTLEFGNKFMVMNKNFKVIRTIDTGLAPYGVYYDRKGERIVLCGPSGSGKSTLIRCINHLESYQKGEIRVGGTRLGDDA